MYVNTQKKLKHKKLKCKKCFKRLKKDILRKYSNKYTKRVGKNEKRFLPFRAWPMDIKNDLSKVFDSDF